MIRSFLLGFLLLTPHVVTSHVVLAQGVPVRLPITADDGSPIMNHQIMPSSTAAAEKLPGAVVATFLRGKPTVLDGRLVESVEVRA